MNLPSVRSFRTSLAALSLASLAVATSAQAVKVGEPAPAFSATDSNGKQVSLAQFKGKYVVQALVSLFKRGFTINLLVN